MLDTTVAKIYAEALFLAASDKKQVREYAGALISLRQLFAESPEFYGVFTSPIIDKQIKHKIIDGVCKGFPADVVNLLHVLVIKHREKIFGGIISEYLKIIEEQDRVVPVEVVSAAALTEGQKKEISDMLSGALQRKIKIEEKVNADIVGGIIVKTEDLIIDGSLKNYLEQFRERLVRV